MNDLYQLARQVPEGSSRSVLECTELAAQLEGTRTAFHQLLRSAVRSVWEEQAVGSAWIVREEMWHIAWGVQFMADLIRNARRGVGLPRPPKRLADQANVLYTRFRARRATAESIARRYDRTHEAVLGLLSRIQDDEWDKSVQIFGEVQSIRALFEGICHHFDEHSRRIRPLLTVE